MLSMNQHKGKKSRNMPIRDPEYVLKAIENKKNKNNTTIYKTVPDTCPRLLINREKAGHCSGIMAMLGMGTGLDFDSPTNTRDVAWLGDCDEGCQLLADKLGWGDELKNIVKTEHERIDKEKEAETKKSKDVKKIKQETPKEDKKIKQETPEEDKKVKQETPKEDKKIKQETSKEDKKIKQGTSKEGEKDQESLKGKEKSH